MRKNKGETRRRAYVDKGSSYIRSRTVSGYSPDKSSEQSIELEHAKEQKKRNRQKRRQIVGVSLLIFILLVVFAFSQLSINVASVEYNDSTVSKEQDDDYLAAANQYLTEHPSQRFAWARRNSSLTEFMQKMHPEIADVQIRGGFGAGKLYIEIRQAVAVWKTQSASSFVDKEGVVFDRNYFRDPSIVIEDRSGSGVVSQRFLQFIGKIIAGIKSSGIGEVDKVVIPVGAIRYVEINITDKSYSIKIQTDRDDSSQVADIVNMIKYLDKNNITPNYIDVRVKNRGFWR